MRILMVNKYLYPRAGAETYMITLAKKLTEYGHSVAFFGMEHPENVDFAPTYTIPFIEFGERATKRERFLSIGKTFVDTLASRQKKLIARACEEFRPDLIHAHNVYNQLAPDLLSNVNEKIPVIMTAHDYQIVCPSYNLFTKGKPCKACLRSTLFSCVKNRCVQESILKSTLAAFVAYLHKVKDSYNKSYRTVVAPSEFMKRLLIEGGIPSEKICVIHNFASLKPHLEKVGKQLLYVGRLSKEKGITTLIEAYKRVRGERPPLSIVGEGPEEQVLKARAKSCGLHGIKWLGRLNPEDVEKEIDRSKYVIVPSEWYENCSMTILESLSRGRAVITSPMGGNVELVEEGASGYFFETGSARSLAALIERLQVDDMLVQKLGEGARKRVEEHFQSDLHIKKIEALYKKEALSASSADILGHSSHASL